MKKLNHLFIIVFSFFAINLSGQITLTITGCNASVDGTYTITATGEVIDGKETFACTGCGPSSSNLEMAWDGTQWVATVSGTIPIPFSITYGTNINCTPTPPCEGWDTPLCPASENVITGDCSPLPVLPVEMTVFDAQIRDKKVKIDWTTVHEINNQGFEVRHSTDGISWSILDFIEGQVHSHDVLDYSYMHNNPSNGDNYYQLKQVDLDGAESYSNIRAVNFGQGSGLKFQISPNPIGSARILNISRYGKHDTAILSILDQAGKLVKHGMIEFKTDKTEVSLKDLDDGIYFVNLSFDNESSTQRIFLVH